mmetsp:Transcript_60955/g.108309  ORF Transcript_60955/g.108309 Transcript_60955/m.108309 type:complete len:631 (+) Transcript_60955:71-1963(+)|eukprot:CAMPEP_0197648388 /NCGR_PEP_ID=MMETSP1338-20131121/27725_1 /TAXON_ID=43686 ORGANISM="Pelagodinium beii, Strain RCC1491" /NCGR_SAMPLE_ID=MMETSP1338 /ASSEMBLY_ACC=CAM_ASM_000754 /LENGTH=630 /DNA_ID=CAMNT_0043222375 /DNA_START=65 /DNA_END=1957 /DNA_ORIENTATION=-
MAQPAELTSPLAVIDRLFEPHAKAAVQGGAALPAEWGERLHFVKSLGLEDEENYSKIPCLNDVELAESIPPFSLVRYRCLVQDIFDREIYSSVLEEKDCDPSGAATGPSRLVSTKYRDSLPAVSGKMLQEVGREGLSQRGAAYCVPLPGETAWVRSLASSGGLTPRGHGGYGGKQASKRARPDEDVDMDVPPPPEADHVRPPRRQRAAQEASALVATGKEVSSDEFGLNFPLPWEERRGAGSSTACIVKLYDDDADTLKVCESVEILGILCVDPDMANMGQDTPGVLFPDARSPSTALVPRLHGLIVRRLPFYNPLLPFSPQWLSEARLASAFQRRLAAPGALAAARGVAISLLQQALGNDAVAAEYVLMLLASRVFARHGEMALGRWSMNLARWPEGLQVKQLFDSVSELVPRAVHLPITAESLCSGRWKPSKDFDANRLVAGKLQLAAGTMLLLDESSMGVGQLDDAGVKAMQAIRSLLEDQLLMCDYCNYDVKIPSEVNCLVASSGPAIIQGSDVLLPMKPSDLGSSPSLPGSGLDAARFFLGLITRNTQPLRIPDNVATVFSEDFARVRQELQVGQELGHVWMTLARAQCLTHGEAELSVERWRSVFELEKERLRRCKAEGMMQAR